jgi:hypothetical protein
MGSRVSRSQADRSQVGRSQISRLPDRFPVGTKYVIESHGGRILRYLEFPDGRHVALPAGERAAGVSSRCGTRTGRRAQPKATAKNISRAAGTDHRLGG